MTPKEILLKAVELVEDRGETFACLAIGDVVGLYGPNEPPEEYYEAMEKFVEMFEPDEYPMHGGGGWWPMDAGGKRKRVEALRATAATFD